MPLSEDEREIIEVFRDYVEGAVAADDRYGPPTRQDRDDESTLAIRFEAAAACWFEVAVRPFVPQLRVGFLTKDQTRSEEIEQAVAEAGSSLEAFVGDAFRDDRRGHHGSNVGWGGRRHLLLAGVLLRDPPEGIVVCRVSPLTSLRT